MWMQPAPAHHLGPMRMGLREPVETNPLCRVASHALFGPRLRSGSPPVPNGLKLPEPPRNASGKLRNARTHRLVSRLEPAAAPAVSNGSYPTPGHSGAAHPSRGSRPQPNRIKSNALANGGHAGREQTIRSRRGWSVRPGTSHRSIPHNQTTRLHPKTISMS